MEFRAHRRHGALLRRDVRDRRVAFLFPLIALFAGDLFVGFHRLIPVVYASFLLSVCIGTGLANRRGILRVGGPFF